MAKNIVFSSGRKSGSGIFLKAANGTGEEKELETNSGALRGTGPATDAFCSIRTSTLRRGATWGLWRWSGGHKVTKFLQSEFNETAGKFSPETQGPPRYVAYVSDESGSYEVYVTTFPDPKEGKWIISNGGGYQPRWRRDGKELLYFTGDGKLMSVDVTLSPSFKAGTPNVPVLRLRSLAAGHNTEVHRWDLTPDGQKFLINTTPNDQSSTIAVVVNWQAALKK